MSIYKIVNYPSIRTGIAVALTLVLAACDFGSPSSVKPPTQQPATEANPTTLSQSQALRAKCIIEMSTIDPSNLRSDVNVAAILDPAGNEISYIRFNEASQRFQINLSELNPTLSALNLGDSNASAEGLTMVEAFAIQSVSDGDGVLVFSALVDQGTDTLPGFVYACRSLS